VSRLGGMEVLRYTAFSDEPSGGNPAGVVLDPGDVDEATMLEVAAEVGYSETAYLWALDRAGSYRIRYYSPAAEVPFCGHATIASAVALADTGRGGELLFDTESGEVAVSVVHDPDGRATATLTSVTPSVGPVDAAVVREALAAFGWTDDDIDPLLPPRASFAGAHHLVFGVRSRALLAAMSYDFERLRELMTRQCWTTVEVVWRESPTVFHARVPFPVGGVVEDPATGAGAAALGAYLRALGLVDPPATVIIHQGDDMGRPSLLAAAIDPGSGGIHVSGRAVPIPD
jgi:PhzF family phenazine biosynthesis protein